MGDTVSVYNVHTLHSIILYAVCGNLCVQLFMVFTDEPVRAKVEAIKHGNFHHYRDLSEVVKAKRKISSGDRHWRKIATESHMPIAFSSDPRYGRVKLNKINSFPYFLMLIMPLLFQHFQQP